MGRDPIERAPARANLLKSLGRPPAVLIDSAFCDHLLAAASVAARADGLVSKASLGSEPCDAIRRAASSDGRLPLVATVVVTILLLAPRKLSTFETDEAITLALSRDGSPSRCRRCRPLRAVHDRGGRYLGSAAVRARISVLGLAGRAAGADQPRLARPGDRRRGHGRCGRVVPAAASGGAAMISPLAFVLPDR